MTNDIRIKYIEVANLEKAKSYKLKVCSSFILPNGKIYYDISNHANATFLREIIYALSLLKVNKKYLKVKSVVPYHFNGLNQDMGDGDYQFYIIDDTIYPFYQDYHNLNEKIYHKLCEIAGGKLKLAKMGYEQFDVRYTIHNNNWENKTKLVLIEYRDDFLKYEKAIKELELDLKNIKTKGLSLVSARKYLNCNVLDFEEYSRHNPLETGFYSSQYEEMVMRLIEAKLFVLKDFKNLLLQNKGHLLEELEDILEIPYLEKSGKVNNYFLEDLAVMYLNFDKIEMNPKRIVSNSFNIYEKYFNLNLLGFDLARYPKIVFDEGTFHKKDISDFGIVSKNEEKFQEEAEMIKRKVPLEERHKFFL